MMSYVLYGGTRHQEEKTAPPGLAAIHTDIVMTEADEETAKSTATIVSYYESASI